MGELHLGLYTLGAISDPFAHTQKTPQKTTFLLTWVQNKNYSQILTMDVGASNINKKKKYPHF